MSEGSAVIAADRKPDSHNIQERTYWTASSGVTSARTSDKRRRARSELLRWFSLRWMLVTGEERPCDRLSLDGLSSNTLQVLSSDSKASVVHWLCLPDVDLDVWAMVMWTQVELDLRLCQ